MAKFYLCEQCGGKVKTIHIGTDNRALVCDDCVGAPRRFAIEELRRMVKYFDNMNEGFNQQFTHAELHKIWTFAVGEQGKWVHECADRWPDYLLHAVLRGNLGAKIATSIVERASKEAV